MVLFAMAVISDSIANAAKETITQNAQIHHANQVGFYPMIQIIPTWMIVLVIVNFLTHIFRSVSGLRLRRSWLSKQ